MRVVSHSCSNTEIICALGCADYLVGVDQHSDYPIEVVTNLPKVGADLDIDPDKVLALKPDLIIASDTVPGHDQVIKTLQDTAIPLLVLAPLTIDDVALNIIQIANALEVPQRGEQLANQFCEQLDSHTIKQPITRPKILLEWWPKPVIVPGKHSWATQLIHLAGGINPLAEENCQSRAINDEQACQINPDIIVMSWCGVASKNYRPHIVSRRPAWQNINAVQHNKIIPISEAYLGRPGPRLIQGLQLLRAACQTIYKPCSTE